MIDWKGFGLPKTGETPKRRRASRKRKAQAEANADRDARVMGRFGGKCIAWRVSPVCQGQACDPHELIPVGIGGKRESWNRVPVCRACHRAAQGRVGGLLLRFVWPGKDAGALPDADVPGNVQPVWG